MKNILITGATGNIGIEVIRFLLERGTEDNIKAGVRDLEKAKQIFTDYPQLSFVHFDFETPDTFDNALTVVYSVFLLNSRRIKTTTSFSARPN